jgi:enamine deaminase RidA (YjgF/YER057c/UK114 family)
VSTFVHRERTLQHRSHMANNLVGQSRRWPSHVAAGPFLFFSGQMGRAREGAFVTRYAEAPNVGDRANTAFDWVSDMEAPVGAQATAIYERYRDILGKEGSDLGHLLRYHIYQRDKHFFSVFDRIRRTYETNPPARFLSTRPSQAPRSYATTTTFRRKAVFCVWAAVMKTPAMGRSPRRRGLRTT